MYRERDIDKDPCFTPADPINQQWRSIAKNTVSIVSMWKVSLYLQTPEFRMRLGFVTQKLRAKTGVATIGKDG